MSHATDNAGSEARTSSEVTSLEKPSVVSPTPCRLCQKRNADGCLPDGTPICKECAAVEVDDDRDCPHDNTRRIGRVSNAGEAIVELRCDDCGMSLGQVNAP